MLTESYNREMLIFLDRESIQSIFVRNVQEFTKVGGIWGVFPSTLV